MKTLTITAVMGALCASMFVGQAEALTRSCKALHYARYFVREGGRDIKKHVQGPQNVLGRGGSPGPFASPVKARRRACTDAARKAMNGFSYERAKELICRKHPRRMVRIYEMGGWGQSLLEIQTVKRQGVNTAWIRCTGGVATGPRPRHPQPRHPGRGHGKGGKKGNGRGPKRR